MGFEGVYYLRSTPKPSVYKKDGCNYKWCKCMVLRVKLIILCFFAVCTFCYSQCQFGKKNEKQVKNIDSSSIINTIWVYNVADSCQDYVLFKNSTEYENYSCEKGDTIWGIYTIRIIL